MDFVLVQGSANHQNCTCLGPSGDRSDISRVSFFCFFSSLGVSLLISSAPGWAACAWLSSFLSLSLSGPHVGLRTQPAKYTPPPGLDWQLQHLVSSSTLHTDAQRLLHPPPSWAYPGPGLPCPVFALSPCPFLPIDLLKSWQSLTPGHPQWPQLVYLQAHRGGTHTMVLGSQKSVLHASSYVCRTTCVFSFNSVYFFSCFLFPLPSSLYPSRRLLILPQPGGCEFTRATTQKGYVSFPSNAET